MPENLKQLYEFESFRLDTGERLLSRSGEAVPLTPKAFDLLVALVEQPGRLLEKGVLLKTVWPDSVVEENNLADNISRLRKVLGEADPGPKFIETIPKYGYRFVAPVRTSERTSKETFLPSMRHRLARRVLVAASGLLALVAAGLWLNFRVTKSVALDQLETLGGSYASKWTEREVRQGIKYYTRAIALDPKSVSAYEGLATAWGFLSDLHVSPREAMPKSKAAVMQALRLDPQSSQAHISLAVMTMEYEWDFPGAEREFKRAIALDPTNSAAHNLYGWYLTAVGRFEEAAREMKPAAASDPLTGFNSWELGMSYYFARQPEKAIEQFRRATVAEPDEHWPHMLLGWAYAQQGKFSEAIDELKHARRLNDNPQILAGLGHAYARSGRLAGANEVLAELREAAKTRYVSPYDVAVVYAGLGDKEQALIWLEKAYADRSGWLAWWANVDPRFDRLRADPRFLDLLRRVGHLP